MSHINSVTVSGVLTRDPEVVEFASGKLARLGIAVERQYKPSGADEYTKETSFLDLTVFGSFGELVGRKLKKADKVTVNGRLQQQTWDDKDTGDKRSKVVIIVTDIDSQGMFRTKAEESQPAGESSPQESQTQAATAADDDIPF